MDPDFKDHVTMKGFLIGPVLASYTCTYFAFAAENHNGTVKLINATSPISLKNLKI